MTKQTNKIHIIESHKNEVRYFTSDPEKMLNRWIASNVEKKWTEDFKDEATGKTVPIERSEILFLKGKLIDQDLLQKIRFSMMADGIKEIEVSNQNRQGYELQNETLFPYVVQVNSNDKKRKYMLLASSIKNAMDITIDYAETHSQDGFWITMIKEMGRCYIINDPSLNYAIDDTTENDEPEYDENGNEIKPVEKKIKFFQIDLNVKDQFDIAADLPGVDETMVVQTCSAEEAMELIKKQLEENEDNRIERVNSQAEKNGVKPNKEDLERRIFTISTYKLGPLPIYDMIPRELSYAYNK